MQTGIKLKQGTAVQYGKASLKREDMLRLKNEFDRVRSSEHKIRTKSVIMLITESTDGRTRFGIICGRKFDKRAVVRNRARRLIKESFRRIKTQMPLKHILFIPRKEICSLKMQEVQRHIIGALKQNNLWLPPDIQDGQAKEIEKTKHAGCTVAPLIWLIRCYQFLTPWMNCCRFYPSCSNYAIQALKRHGLVKGLILSGYRIFRCQPYCWSGYDPVPEKFTFKVKKTEFKES